MENFKEALIQFAHSNPSLFPNDDSSSCSMLIEQYFPQFFSDFQTPNHPTYSAMIYSAICELNKKGGSSEKSISKFIKKKYADLPWAHPTLLKHHLQKLCDRNEVCVTDKQCYLLAGAEAESEKKSSGPDKKHKKQKILLGSKMCKKLSRPHKKIKKEKCLLDIQETNEKEQIGIHKRKRKQKLMSKKKSSKRVKKHEIIETKLQLLNLSEANLKQDNDESPEQNQMLEVYTGEMQIQEQNEAHNDKLQLLNEANLKQNNDDSHEQNQMLEVYTGDIQIQEQNEAGQESQHGNSGDINLEQTQTKNDFELLQPEQSPDPNPILHGIGKRVRTRSQLKKDALAASSELTESAGYINMPKGKPAIVEDLSNEEQPISSPSSEKPLIEIFKSISSKLMMTRVPDDEPAAGQRSTKVQDQISSQQDQQLEKSTVEDRVPDDEPAAGQRSTKVQDPFSAQKDQQLVKSTVEDRVPDDEPAAGQRSTEVQDPISSQQDQQPEKSTVEDKPKYKRRGRRPKPIEPKTDEVLRNSKSADVPIKSRKAAKKGKVGKKKLQPMYKRDDKHKMTRRSSRK